MADEFAALLAEQTALGADAAELAKALKADADKGGTDKIRRAAAEGGTAAPESRNEPDPREDEGEDEDAEQNERFGKAFQVTLSDGEVAEVYDGTEFIKALTTRQSGADSKIADQAAKIDSLGKLVVAQAALLKSLTEAVKGIGHQPAGRRAVVSAQNKVVDTSPQAAKIAGPQVLAKAQSLAAGAVNGFTWEDAMRTEAFLLRTGSVPPDLAHHFAPAA